jgi:hypothetical protein
VGKLLAVQKFSMIGSHIPASCIMLSLEEENSCYKIKNYYQ